MRSPSAFEVRMMFGPTQVAASISTRVVSSETSEIWPPITPGDPARALGVADQRHRRR